MNWLPTQIVFLVMAIQALAVIAQGGGRFHGEDLSPYCQDLVKIFSLCSSSVGFFLCRDTCHKGQPRLSCGQPFITRYRLENKARRVKRIVGGIKSKEGAWPWQVALLLHGKQYCGGVVLTPEWVLTAAHCFGKYSSSKVQDWEVVLGEHHLNKKEVFEQRRKISNYLIHPENYRFWKDGLLIPDIYDIALIKLSSPVTFTRWVNPICLPSDNVYFGDNHKCKIVGWGHTSYQGTKANVLNEATVLLVSRQVCNLPISYNGTIHKSSLCAGFEKGGVDACQYDSGGPLSCSHQNRWYLQGLVSWGFRCALPDKYGVYANVPFLKDWVVNSILSYNQRNNRFSGRLFSLLNRAGMKAGLKNKGQSPQKNVKESSSKKNLY